MAEVLRLATFAPGLSRAGPGLLLRDIEKGEDAQVAAAVAVIAAAHPDILLLTDFDWDNRGIALEAFAAQLRAAGVDYPHHFAPRPNSGMDTGLDIDGNGQGGEARDAQGYGAFPGQHGMALLSRLPIEAKTARDFSALLWADLPGSQIDGAGLSEAARAVQRLSSTGHWDVAVQLDATHALQIWAMAATPPLFDGPEDRNGRRNRDETAFWLRYLDGDLTQHPRATPFVLMGDLDLDPERGEGRRDALTALLSDLRLQDPHPRRAGAAPGAPDAEATADFGGRSGSLRTDYILPATGLKVLASGVLWPDMPSDPLAEMVSAASRHRLVWVDIDAP